MFKKIILWLKTLQRALRFAYGYPTKYINGTFEVIKKFTISTIHIGLFKNATAGECYIKCKAITDGAIYTLQVSHVFYYSIEVGEKYNFRIGLTKYGWKIQ